MKHHIVIVGAGFGGITLAKKLARTHHKITLVDKSNHHLFQPLLYQVAAAALSPGDISAPVRSILGKFPNIDVVLAEVTGIDASSKLLLLGNGEKISYDKLVLATGTRYNYFGNDQWKKYALSLKTTDDAIRIRERILLSLEKAEQIKDPAHREPLLTYVIVGGGPTGVEMAGAIAEIAKRNMMRDYRNISKNETRIFLVEAGDTILSQYPDHLSEKAKQILEDMGVRVLTNTPVKDIRKHEVDFGQWSIKTPNIIWAAGVKGEPVLSTLQTELDAAGRVVVEPDLSVPGYSDIYVIGDAAHLKDSKGKPLPALAPVAIQQGSYLARAFRDQNQQTITAFKYTDKGNMATIGRAKAVADIRGFTTSGFIAWLLWSLVHIFFLIGFRNRFRVFIEWTWFYFSFKRRVRLITGREQSEHPVDELVKSG